MNTEHRFILEKGSKKYQCPQCGKRRFVRYIDTVENNYLPEQYGRCDRESKCTYHLNPYLDGYSKAIKEQEQGRFAELPKFKPQQKNLQKIAEPQFFDFETFKTTLQPERYEMNNFIQNLFRLSFPFGIDEVTKVIQFYRLGTISHGYRQGANTFPFIDVKGNVRAVQVKQFDEQNHTTGTDFLHSIIEKHHARNSEQLPEWLRLYKEQDKIVSCLFGEHLLSKFPLSPVALVEAPKTAIYGTLYFGMPESPENLLWLAVYNKSSFNFEKLKVLQGRNVFVFPDLSKDGATFKEWQCKAVEVENKLPGTKFIFSELLEQLATEQDKEKGNDLADILIKYDWRLFRKQKPVAEPQPEKKAPEPIQQIKKPKPEAKTIQRLTMPKRERVKKYAEIWNKDITELETFFSKTVLPTIEIKIDVCGTITDISKFIQSNLQTVKANNGNNTYLPYLNRLQHLKQILTANN